MMDADIRWKSCLAQTTNDGSLGSLFNRTLTSMLLLRTTYTCAFMPGCLMSHNWLHAPDCEILSEMEWNEMERNGMK